MALDRDKPAAFNIGDYNDLPVAGGVEIFEGARVSVNANGYAQPLDGADTIFGGIAMIHTDNSAGADGAVRVRVRRGEFYAKGKLAAVAQADVGDPCYSVDDEDHSLSPTNNLLVGTVAGVDGAGVALIKYSTNV